MIGAERIVVSGQPRQDVTESRRLEGATAQNGPQKGLTPTGWERFFWLVFNRSSVPIGLFDDQRVGIAANQAACDYMKRPRAELVGGEIDLYVAPQALESFKLAWNRLLRFGDWIGAVDLVRSDGVLLHTEFAGRTTLIDRRRLVLGVLIAGEPRIAQLTEVAGELTPRERSVVHLITLGLTTQEIATRLSIYQATVRTHVRNAMAKTGTKTRAQLVAVALADQRTYGASE